MCSRGEAEHGHGASEITSLEGQAFPLSHMAELNTQHRLDTDCVLIVFGKGPSMTAHYIPGEWNLCQLLPKNALFYHCIMKICACVLVLLLFWQYVFHMLSVR